MRRKFTNASKVIGLKKLPFIANRIIFFIAGFIFFAAGETMVPAQSLKFQDDFESGLKRWELYGNGGAEIIDSGDPVHKQVLLLRPQGDVYALVKKSAEWGGVRLEGEVLFPDEIDNYLGVVYNFQRRKRRTDFGLIYIKGNDSYLIVNPHRDFNVNRTLYEEYRTPLKGDAAIRTGKWQRFKAEIIGRSCHFYVGNMNVPQLIFSSLELSSGAVGLQPRSVGGDVWVDNILITAINKFSYDGISLPNAPEYELEPLLTHWEAIGPLAQTSDDLARNPAKIKWNQFRTDDRGAVVTGRLVDYHGPRTVAYFRTRVQSGNDRLAYLEISSVDDLALWVNGRFHWFIPRRGLAWYDFWKNAEHQGQRIPIELKKGANDLVFRTRGGVYASGGFFARIE
jgi:hypothetical protein